MFQRLFKRAESAAETAIDQILGKYIGRVMVAIPLLAAGGFATAALTTKLVELYGSTTGYALMAAVFAVVGLAMMAVGVGSRTAEAPAAEPSASTEREESQEQAATSDDDPSDLLTPELRAVVASLAPIALPGLARGIVKNIPLVVILAVLGFIISRFPESSGEEAGDATPPDADADAASASPEREAPAAAAA
jgi:hypothetical protein